MKKTISPSERLEILKEEALTYAKELAILYREGKRREKELWEKAKALELIEKQAIIYARELNRGYREIKRQARQLKEAYDATLLALVTALDAREHEVQAHSQRVCEYTVMLARGMGIGGKDLEDIRMGALLHDIGKIGISDSILLKPGKLTEEEWEEMKKHPYIGYRILEDIEFLKGAVQIVYAHHERFDGRGYPRGLKGKEIPVGARLFAVADTLDAMTSDRPYRKAMPFETAREEIIRCSGTQFDPDVVEIFLGIPRVVWLEKKEEVESMYGGRRF